MGKGFWKKMIAVMFAVAVATGGMSVSVWAEKSVDMEVSHEAECVGEELTESVGSGESGVNISYAYEVSDIVKAEFFCVRDVFVGVDGYETGIGINLTMSDGNKIYIDWGHEYDYGGKYELNKLRWALSETECIQFSVDDDIVDDNGIVKNRGIFTVNIFVSDLNIEYNKSMEINAVENPVSSIEVRGELTRKIALVDLQEEMDIIGRHDVIVNYADFTSIPLWESWNHDHYTGWAYMDGSMSYFLYNTKLYDQESLDHSLSIHGCGRYQIEYVFGKELEDLVVGETYPLIITYMGCEIITYITVTEDETEYFDYYVDYIYEELEDGTLEINDYAGSETELIIPETREYDGKRVTKIGEAAFSHCNRLTRVVIPEGVTNIGWCAFSCCSELTSVTIPSSVTSIDDSAFEGCINLTISCVENSYAHTYAVENNIPFSFRQPSVHPLTYTVTFDANGGAILSQSSCTVEEGTALGTLPTVLWTDHILKGWYTEKMGGTAVTKDTIVTENITLYAQWDVVLTDENNQQNIVGETKQSIASAKVTLSRTSYSYDGKAKKPTVKSVKLGNTALKYGKDYIAEISYKNNKNIGKATVTVELIGKGNYTGKASISVTFTISAKRGTSFTVGSYKYKITDSQTVAFSGLKSAKTNSLKIPKTVKIGGKSFKVTSIAGKALKNANVTSVIISENITKIGSNAFLGCRKLATVTIKTTMLKTVGKNAFKEIKSNARIKVPAKKLSIYKKLLKGKGMGGRVKITK